MLALSRRQGESLSIILPDGRTVEVTFVEVWPGKVRVGVQADQDIKIYRTELLADGLRKEGA